MIDLLANYWFVFALVALASAVLFAIRAKRRRHARIKAELADRDPLTSDQFAEKYFGQSAEKKWLASQLHDFVAERSFVDASRIRPSDSLQKIGIRFASDFDLAWTLEARFGLNFGGADLEKMEQLDEQIETFDDLVNELINAKHQPWPIERYG